MFFLNENLMAAFLSIIAFCISFFSSLAFGSSLKAAILRGSVVALIFVFAGILFGNLIKNIIVEAFLAEKEKKSSEAEDSEEGEDDEEYEEYDEETGDFDEGEDAGERGNDSMKAVEESRK